VKRADDWHGEAACLKSNLHNVTVDQCVKNFERGSFKGRMLRPDVPRINR
jgi:hypothetical protein